MTDEELDNLKAKTQKAYDEAYKYENDYLKAKNKELDQPDRLNYKEIDRLKDKALKAHDTAEKHENDLVRAMKTREDKGK